MPVDVSAYVPLANVTLGSAAATVTFSSITQIHSDLVLVVNPVGTAQLSFLVRTNSDAGTNYSVTYAAGPGNTNPNYVVGVDDTTGFRSTTLNVDTSRRFNLILNLMAYSATNKNKTALIRSNNDSGGTELGVGRWVNTAAVTTLSCVTTSSTFAAGSTFSLYGVSA